MRVKRSAGHLRPETGSADPGDRLSRARNRGLLSQYRGPEEKNPVCRNPFQAVK